MQIISAAEVEAALDWDSLIERLRQAFRRGAEVPLRHHHEIVEAGARGAHIISCATLSKEPLIRGDWLRPGQHLDLVGAYRPDMRESDDAAIRRSRVFVDTRAGALAEAGDIVQPIESGALDAEDVAGDLFDLTRGERAGRRFYDQITLFKSVGTALEDLAAAELAAERI